MSMRELTLLAVLTTAFCDGLRGTRLFMRRGFPHVNEEGKTKVTLGIENKVVRLTVKFTGGTAALTAKQKL